MPMPGFEHGGSDLWSSTLPLDDGGALGYNKRLVYPVDSTREKITSVMTGR